MDTAGIASRQSEIPELNMEMNAALEELGKTVDALRGRLDPVTYQQPKVTPGDPRKAEAKGYKTPLSGVIGEHIDRIRSITHQLQEAMEQLEI